MAVRELWVPGGDKVSVGKTQPLPRLCPSACLAVPNGHLSQVRLAEGRAPYGCLQSLCGQQVGVVGWLLRPQSQPRPVPKRPFSPAGSQEAK